MGTQVGQKPKRPKGQEKSLKRKREVEDHDKLQKAVEELVGDSELVRDTR